jgi:nitrile hydratase beta subunit
MQDFGPVLVEPREPVFHAAWEERVFGVTATMGLHRLYSVNAFRHAIERMDPVHYLGSPYFEHWLTALATLLVEHGVIEREQLEQRTGAPFPLARPARAARRRAGNADAATQPAPFAPGDRVRVRATNPRGHTRCPRYVRGRRGVVERCDGAFALPDAEAHGDDPQDEPTYCVRFEATELWGEDAELRASVSVDLWHSYLERT